MTYQEQLLTDEWKLRRQQIIHRDFGICQKCMSSKNLNVHHLTYIDGRMAWDYEDFYLITLCGECHAKAHEGKDIKEFVGNRDLTREAWARINFSIWALRELEKRTSGS